jgi:hypothetical protein
MKCAGCDRKMTKDAYKKQRGLCTTCLKFDKKWVKQGLKYSKRA